MLQNLFGEHAGAADCYSPVHRSPRMVSASRLIAKRCFSSTISSQPWSSVRAFSHAGLSSVVPWVTSRPSTTIRNCFCPSTLVIFKIVGPLPTRGNKARQPPKPARLQLADFQKRPGASRADCQQCRKSTPTGEGSPCGTIARKSEESAESDGLRCARTRRTGGGRYQASSCA